MSEEVKELSPRDERLSKLILHERNEELSEVYNNLMTSIGRTRFIRSKLERYKYIVMCGLTTLSIYRKYDGGVYMLNCIMGRQNIANEDAILDAVEESERKGKCLFILC